MSGDQDAAATNSDLRHTHTHTHTHACTHHETTAINIHIILYLLDMGRVKPWSLTRNNNNNNNNNTTTAFIALYGTKPHARVHSGSSE